MAQKFASKESGLPYALVLGASEGIGADIAIQLALRQTHSLILVARDEKKLRSCKEHIKDALCEHLSTQWDDRFDILIVQQDLSLSKAAFCLYNKVKHLDIGILIVNAGTALTGPWEKHHLHAISNMNALNMTSLAELVHIFLPSIQTASHSPSKRKSTDNFVKAGILTVSSIAGLMPVPSMAGYAATKAFVLSLTEAIHHEQNVLKSGVHISCVLPGPTRSKLWNKEGGNAASVLAPWSTTADVASASLAGLDKNAAVIVPGFSNQLMAFGLRFAPRFLIRRMAMLAMNQWAT